MNYYEILGVSKNASFSEIKSAYRKLSMKYHPDKGGDAEKFKGINDAYQTLGDKEKKKMYDMQQNNPFMNRMNGMNGMDGMDNIFSMFFGGRNPMETNFNHMNNFGPRVKIFRDGVPVNLNQFKRPTPIIKTIEITLEDSFNGMNYALEVERWIFVDNIKKTEKERIYVTIPKGVDHNEIILIKQKGNIIDENNKGDIKLFIKIKNNSKFIRDGINLIYKKDLTLKESLVGFSFDLDYFNGKKFSINNGGDVVIKPNYHKIIPGLGLSRGPSKGNLIIVFNIIFPDKLSKETKDKLINIL